MKKLKLVILALILATLACGGDPSGGSGSDLADPKWDMYFECTARQRDGGYSVVEAGNRCEALRPEGE